MDEIVYVSFLGAGNYQSVRYRWGEDQAEETPYAQEAELELLCRRRGVQPGDVRVLVFGTETSERVHWHQHAESTRPRGLTPDIELGPGLEQRIAAYEPRFVRISEDLSPSDQWETFEQLLDRVPPGARLVLDMTHGFRAVPVVFSSALHFLRLVRGVQLEHVLYAARETTTIVDYADFYAIHDWTQAVSRLVMDANASPLAALAERPGSLAIYGLADPALATALARVSDGVRNVEVHGIEGKVRDALALVGRGLERARREGNTTSAILLELVHHKFAGLAAAPPLSGRYDAPYFELQLRFIELLLEHRLFMQAYTAMRELIGSLGMRGYEPGVLRFSNDKGRKKRRSAEAFLVMVAIERRDWRFVGEWRARVTLLLPWYERLGSEGLLTRLRSLQREISTIRNGFDHAWTSKAGAPEDIEQQGADHLERLRSITTGILDLEPPAPTKRSPRRAPRLLCLMNHQPTEVQREDARQRLGVQPEEWVFPPASIQAAWRSIPPAHSKISNQLRAELTSWIEASGAPGDRLLVHGDPGATHLAVGIARRLGLAPIYATTDRRSDETRGPAGERIKRSVFEHVRFRDYPR